MSHLEKTEAAGSFVCFRIPALDFKDKLFDSYTPEPYDGEVDQPNAFLLQCRC